MKLGRNEPCHCDSGKKYKKCCLKADEKQRRQTSNEAISSTLDNSATIESRDIEFRDIESREELTEKLATSLYQTLEEDDSTPTNPLKEHRDNFWNTFSAAPYAEQLSIAENMLIETPELCDDHIAFEIVIQLYDKTNEEKDLEAFLKIIELIEKQAPEAWNNELHYMLEHQALAALKFGDMDRARAAFLHFSEHAGKDLDIYEKTLSYFTWHSEPEIIIEALSKAKVSVKAAGSQYLEGSYEEVCYKHSILDFYNTLSKITQQDLADTTGAELPQIKAFFKRLENDNLFSQDVFSETITYFLHEKQPSMILEDYEQDIERYRKLQAEEDGDYWEDSEDEADKTVKNTNDTPVTPHLSQLMDNFKHYAHHQENISIPRIVTGSERLYAFLLYRGAGELDEAKQSFASLTKSYGQGTKNKKYKPQKKKKTKKPASPKEPNITETHPLLFTSKQIKNYLDNYGHYFMYRPYHELASFLGLLPAWLRFLNTLGFLDENLNQTILDKLKPQLKDLTEECSRRADDPRLTEQLGNWPE